MIEPNLSFAKIVANPSIYSWSQAYNAGKLFAVLSLETQEDTAEKDYLNVLGKEILDILEQEFFTLETKDLESIKTATQTASEKIPAEIKCSFVVGAFIGSVLYVYIVGDGKVSLKRAGKLGHLLEAYDQETKAIKVASGFLEEEDIVVLQTKQFSKVISTDTLFDLLDGLPPQDAAENIAPILHEKDEPGAASIIVGYKKPVENILSAPIDEPFEEKEPNFTQVEAIDTHNKEEAPQEETPQNPFYTSRLEKDNNFGNKSNPLKSLISKVRLPKIGGLDHPKKVLLTIVVIILVVFIGSVFFALKKQESSKIKAAFASIYPQAEKKYEEGQGLVGLNQSLANDSFQSAKQILEKGKDQLPKNSPEEKQVLSLLAKVNSALGTTASISNSTPQKTADFSQSPLLSAENKNSAPYFSEDDKNIFGLTSDEIYTLNKDGSSKKTIIKNNNIWQSAGGLSVYFGNLYVLDKKQNQIFKFVPTDSSYSKTNYLSETESADFTNAKAITIDSSIYVLFSDGKITKYTKGKEDTFNLTNLDKNLSSPTRIYSNLNFDNIYVLDNGNSRIVVLDKTGAYKTSYQATFIKNATDFDVFEKDKKIFVLSSGKLYEVDLK